MSQCCRASARVLLLHSGEEVSGTVHGNSVVKSEKNVDIINNSIDDDDDHNDTVN